MPEEKKRVSIKSLTEELNALKEKVKKVDILEKQMIEMKGVMELLLEDRKKVRLILFHLFRLETHMEEHAKQRNMNVISVGN